MNFTLRPATRADADWLYALRRVTMQTYVEAAFGHWDAAAQRSRFHAGHELANMEIIELEGRGVGLLHVERWPHEIFLANIHVEPRFQGRGLGTAVIHWLQEEGRRTRRPVRLQVLKTNPLARTLYTRLGFSDLEPGEAHHRMIWRPD
jgi:ribosomal protein S18 acetylase RimI-like enzyme